MADAQDTTSTSEATGTAVGGTSRVQLEGDAEAHAQAEGDKNNQIAPATETSTDDIPGEYTSWEEYGKAVQSGEINPDGSKPEASKSEEEGSEEGSDTEERAELSPEDKALVEDQLKELPEDTREKAKPFFEEFARDGALSEDSRKAAAEAFGVTPEMVDLYVAGAQAQAQQTMDSVLEAAGVTKEEALAFQEFARETYTPEEIAAFDARPAAEAYKEGVAAWKAAGNGPAPRDITKSERPAKPQNEAAVEGYASTSQMTADMNDPRYSKDPAFRAMVEKRVEKSTF